MAHLVEGIMDLLFLCAGIRSFLWRVGHLSALSSAMPLVVHRIGVILGFPSVCSALGEAIGPTLGAWTSIITTRQPSQ